ncbi:MAG: hypothetical protein EOO65_01750 [Methanosarcinales archaeon]|nr:MAG: hypothetical protein EOO65_01750 [Methanosarcinales archaeon]
MHHARVWLQFVGHERSLMALFQRYDLDGAGLLNYTRFAAMVLGLMPNPHGSTSVRYSLTMLRRQLFEQHGALGTRMLVAKLRSHSSVGRASINADASHETVTRDAFQLACRELGVMLRDKELNPLLVEFDAHGLNALEVDQLQSALRGPCAPSVRKCLEFAWQHMPDGDGTLGCTCSVEAIAVSCAAAAHPDVTTRRAVCEGAPLLKHAVPMFRLLHASRAQGAHVSLLQSERDVSNSFRALLPEVATFDDFFTLNQDLLAALPDTGSQVDVAHAMWHVPPMDAAALRALPGTLAHTLRTSTAPPAYSVRL